ncbi:MAG: hypothetical protein RL268_189 [Pseudomonadota bacterium]|jgi:hypothetical protein
MQDDIEARLLARDGALRRECEPLNLTPDPIYMDAASTIAALRAEVERLREVRETICQWLLSDGARLDYEAQPEDERGHQFWWAADMIRSGAALKGQP